MKKNIILGINWEQNSTAALMLNGKIIACSSEERFSRIKNDERYPYNAINWILKATHTKTEEIETVCFISTQWTPGYVLTRHYTNMSIDDYINEQKKIWYPRLYENKKISQIEVFKKKIDLKQYPGKKFWKSKLSYYKKNEDHASNTKVISYGKKIREEVIQKHLNIKPDKIKFIDHSSGHIFYSFFSSKKNEKYMAISIDAFGDGINYRAAIIKNNKNKFFYKDLIKGSNFIIGRLYRYVTLILGLKPNEHEYKVMGISPYTKEKYYQKILKQFFNLQDVKGIAFVNKSKFKDLYFHIKTLLDGKRFDAIAGGLQAYTEKLIEKWIKNLLLKNKIKNICLGGGVAMNVKNNLQISNIKKIKNVFVPPSPDDSSQAMGACYFHCFNEKKNYPKPLENAYLGYEIDNKKIFKILKTFKKSKYIITTKNINSKAARLLSRKKIIGRCSGKAEFGARSLGNRSILSHPGDPDIKEIINEKIKNRDFWMPFAATILDKYAKKYFYLKGNIENYFYMTNCVNTKKEYQKKLSGAIHPYDKTCRPQVLTKLINSDYYDLIVRFGKISKTYALLNTSFNLHGFPLVNDEQDAVKVFKKTDLDALILGKYLIIKK
jgi:carbamoyltransferase